MIRVPDDMPTAEPVDPPRSRQRPLPTEECPCCGQRVIWNPPRITAGELRVVRAFRDYRRTHDVGATTREIAGILQVTQKSVWRHVDTLCERGILSRGRNESRSVVVLWDPDEEPG